MRIFTLMVLVLVGVFESVAAQPPKVEDFAYGYRLETTGETPFYSVPIPYEVYGNVLRRDLGDIRVFDAEKVVVPHQVRRQEMVELPAGPARAVPFFPLYTHNLQKNLSDNLSMRVVRNGAGAIVDVRINGGTEKDERYLRGYLLDLHDLDFAAGSRLELQWRKPENSIVSLSLEQSADLIHWQPLVRKAVLARLIHDNRSVAHREITLPRKPLAYLRITWGIDQPFLLEGVKGRRKGRASEMKRLHRILKNDGTAPKRREKVDRGEPYFGLSYTMPLQVSVSEAQVKLPVSNSSIRAALYSRRDEDAGWRRRCGQVFYRMETAGESLTNQACRFSPTTDNLWELRVFADGAGIADGASPKLELGWVQDELLFAGRGAAPYMLAFGNGKLNAQEQNGSVDHLGRVIDLEKNRELISAAAVKGERITFGGEAALAVPVELPWKKWLLWGVLISGMCLLAAMARMVYRELGSQQAKGNEE